MLLSALLVLEASTVTKQELQNLQTVVMLDITVLKVPSIPIQMTHTLVPRVHQDSTVSLAIMNLPLALMEPLALGNVSLIFQSACTVTVVITVLKMV